ncbi:hypothetical protein IV38_GL000231 [Lactobacillus selangorensis]|uniref:Uncharacterized protein n=1 Tax=Lactobacillus selangorensis TaxID=81857 RepID=A0A0R2FWQ0_9LACO|nr:rod shape-determining protein MreD [Lactobacillus selangorensis]KRN29348.1 hypothetical protein IV38_GL000231 [Lactobacillus selangorensis]KRN34123.1 hypothetical protein IV40_GL000438 [Lactobacillus selangorensis]
MTNLRNRYFLPLGIFVLMLLDGAISHVFSPLLYHGQVAIIIRLMLLGFVLAVYALPQEKWLIWYALLIGILYDSFFTGVIGIYAFILPMVVYLLKVVQPYLPNAFWSLSLVYVIVAAVFEICVYAANTMIGLTTVALSTFMVDVLAPTLILNLVIFFILAVPLTRLLVRIEVEE